MNNTLSGKVALVTGASKGIGQGLAIGLAEAGARVAVNFKTDADGASQTCEQIRHFGGDAHAFGADIGSKEAFEKMIGDICDHFGRLDVLVNNAARTRFGPYAEVTEEDFEEVISTILRGPFFGSVAAARRMKQAGGGSIINISSIAVRQIIRFHSAYTMAKGGLESLTRQFALEMAPDVRVNAIAPTATDNARNLEYDPDFNESWARVTPAGRVGTPTDYVGPCVFLASDAAEFVTGQILYVDGGWTLRGFTPDMTDFDFSSDRQRG